ncbi:MAG: hypothetical protein JWM10_1862 [Myxococcaceae bacterium]|nr:hypothetical protein [Myxococcaceae bacterium]
MPDESGSYDICPVCFWEDDPAQAADPRFAGGANALSLEQCRVHYATFGASDETSRGSVRPPMEDEIPPTHPLDARALEALRFVRWWCHQEPEDLGWMLSEDFLCDSPIGPYGREEFLEQHKITGPIEALELVSLTVRPGWARIVWDGTEWVTLLRRRHHDVIGLRDGRVTRITGTRETILRSG